MGGLLQGLAGGTLLYITFYEVLEREKLEKMGMDGLAGCFLLILGFSIMAGLEAAGAHSHGVIDPHHDHSHHNHQHLHDHSKGRYHENELPDFMKIGHDHHGHDHGHDHGHNHEHVDPEEDDHDHDHDHEHADPEEDDHDHDHDHDHHHDHD